MTDNSEPRPLRPPRRDLQTPRFELPAGACDTHFHIYEADVPLKPERRYTPVEAGLVDYQRMARAVGLERGVVVTGSGHLSNAPTLAAIAAMGGAFKGLALIRPDISDAELEKLANGGMAGFRVSTVSVGGIGPEHIMGLAHRVKDLDWHVEVHLGDVAEVMEVLPILRDLPIPHSLDRVANLAPGFGPGSPEFDAVRDHLVHCDSAYLNIYSFYNLSAAGPPAYEDMVENLRALIAARPDRIIWGSNWPHPSFDVPVPDDGQLMDVLADVAPDPGDRKLILADNPARLYGWDQV